jgi:hypothetical protein
MIDDLSQTLRAILTQPGLPDPLKSAQVVFERPADPFSPQQTTVDLFLYDIRENLELRNNEPVIEHNNGQVTTRRPPLRLACSYLVTAWAGGLTGDAAALLEQRLLSQTLQVLYGQSSIDPSLLQGSLKGQEPPVPMDTALVDPQKNLSEFWTALGNKLRPSLTVRATISAASVRAAETATMVITEHLRFGERTAPDKEDTNPATLEEQFRIGGQVIDASNQPVGAAAVTIVELGLATQTDAAGHFVLGTMKSGAFTLRVKAGAAQRDLAINVPASKGSNYNVQLT